MDGGNEQGSIRHGGIFVAGGGQKPDLAEKRAGGGHNVVSFLFPDFVPLCRMV
jgi:hypothetical protein